MQESLEDAKIFERIDLVNLIVIDLPSMIMIDVPPDQYKHLGFCMADSQNFRLAIWQECIHGSGMKVGKIIALSAYGYEGNLTANVLIPFIVNVKRFSYPQTHA